ncbi:MAG: NADH-quinone oxidoreductase subunit L [Bdellovibrionales bacterium]
MTIPLDIAAVFLPLAGSALAALAGHRMRDRLAQAISCLCMLVAAVASCLIFEAIALRHEATMLRELLPWIVSGDFRAVWTLRIDTLTAVMLVVVNIVSAMVHVYAVGYMAHDKSVPRFMSYLSLFTFFMLMLVTSADLAQMFFGWEGVGLCSYLLINFWYEKDSANKAAIKAFLVNRVGDFGFALGIFACYMLVGTIKFDEIFARVPELAEARFILLGVSVPALSATCLLLFVGAMGKSAQLGLHTWLPDAMEGPTPVSALIHAATMVTAGVFMVARLSPMFELAPTALAVVTVIGALTAIFAAVIGLTQFDIKRVIAYSTMSQLGYMFFATGVSAYSAAIYHLMTHAFFKALLFLCAGSVIHALSGEQDMRKMGGLMKKTPITYALMWIGSLALAGIGIEGVFGFAGFYSKDLILESAIASKTGVGTFAYVLGILAAFMTAFYSWRLLILTFHGKPRGEAHAMEHAHESPFVMLAPLVPLALGAIFAGWLGWEWFGGEHRAEFWNNAIKVLPEHDTVAKAEHVEEIYKLLPLGAALSGIALAVLFYGVMPALPEKIAAALGGFYRLISKKFYFDELYDYLFVRGARKIGTILWRKGDDGVIDRCGPDGVAGAVMRVARGVGALETGYVYHYAFAMVIGVVVYATWFWIKG